MISTNQVSVPDKLEKESGSQRLTFSALKMLLKEYFLFIYMFLFGFFGFVALFLWFILLYINFKLTIFLIIGYYSWVSYDSRTLNTEGRRSYWFKNLPIFNFVRDYFPLRMVKTADLPPGKPYIFAAFPHGALPFGSFYNLMTNTNKLSELYPGIDIRGITFSPLFYFPLVREGLIALGCCTTNKQNILYLLESDPPKSVVLTPGGLKEMTNSHPGNKYTIVKENRKGFVKIALETGSSLVPCFSFGENNSLEQRSLKNEFLVNLVSKITQAKITIMIGRGIFFKKFGVLPHRRPITSVIGRPIPVPKVKNPSKALIDEYHELFHKELRNLFEENKRLYDEFGDDAILETI